MIDAVRIAEQSCDEDELVAPSKVDLAGDVNCIMRMRVGENPTTPAETLATACSAYGAN